MTYVGDFTFTKDEAFGVYHIDISQKSTLHVRATVKNYEQSGVYIFVQHRAKNQIHAGRI